MKHVNQYLSTAWRNSLFGYNMATRGLRTEPNRHPELRSGQTTPAGLWGEPAFGMQGTLCLAHEVPIVDAVTVTITDEGRPLFFHPTRNHWTPAYMETIYRCEAEPEYYPNSGTLSVKEKKAILREDVFIAHMTLTNQKREERTITVTLAMPLTALSPTIYEIDTHTVPRGIGQSLPVRGYAVLDSDAGGRTITLRIPPKGQATLRYAMAFSPKNAGKDTAEAAVRRVLTAEDPFKENERCFDQWFAAHVPQLDTPDEDLKKIYYYRFYLIYRSIHTPSDWVEGHPIPGPCMYESPYGSWFGTVIGLPVPWQMGEARWLRDHPVLHSHMQNWSEGRSNYQNYIQFTPYAIWQCYRLHPDPAWLASIYDGCKAYGQRILAAPLPPLTPGSWGTGAEYQPSFYQFTPEPWDWRYDVEGARTDGFPKKNLYRADHISYTALSLLGCAYMAEELHRDEDSRAFREGAETLIAFLKEKLWDEEQGLFFDFDPEANQRCTQAPCYDSFAPYMANLVGQDYIRGVHNLLDILAAEYGALSAGRDCPMFWYDNCIAGPTASSTMNPHEYGCSWNGPVWPYANSLVSEGLGTAAWQDPSLRERWLDFFHGYTELHFIYGDRGTPVICEHYRPDDGASFSLFSDYFHSSWIDQFMRFYAGIQQAEDGTIRFTPFTRDPFVLSGIKIGGHTYDFIHEENGTCTVRQTFAEIGETY